MLGAASLPAAAEDAALDWSVWQRLPVLDDGRIMPLDTYARVQVKEICGTENPHLRPPSPDGPEGDEDTVPRRFGAAELLFCWLAEPEAWERVEFLQAADPELRREILELPLVDEHGRKLTCVSPQQVLDSPRFWQRCEQLAAWQREGKSRGATEMLGLDKKVQDLFGVYLHYRRLTYTPDSQRKRFLKQFDAISDAWNAIESQMLRFPAVGEQMNVAEVAQQTAATLRKLAALRQGGDPRALDTAREQLGWLERLTATLAEQAAEIPDLVRQSGDAASGDMRRMQERLTELANKTAEVARRVRKARSVLHYDGGESLWLVPALDPGPLEADRYRTEGQPWLSLQTLIFGGDAQLRDFPAPEVREVRAAYEELLRTYRDRESPERPQKFREAMEQFRASLEGLGKTIEPRRRGLPIKEKDGELMAATAYPAVGSTDAEVRYNQLDPFFWALVVCGGAAAVLLASLVPALRKPAYWAGIALLTAGLATVLAGLALRGYITGWFPLTGMFETFAVVAACAMLLGMVFALLPQESFLRSLVVLAGVLVAILCLYPANFVALFQKEIEPPRAVLRDNRWLFFHVTAILASYGAAAMAGILGNAALLFYLFGKYRPSPAVSSAEPARSQRRSAPEVCGPVGNLIYKLVQVAVLMLAVGTILGGLWADKSWGRFWGWDSKEVWALVSLLVYMILLHLRHVGLSGPMTMAFGSVFGFWVVLMTWYGVNFILASGKHAYASGSGGTWALTVLALVEAAFLGAAGLRYFARYGVERVNGRAFDGINEGAE
jgi:ABC-type transport system involved in cytochrome c biogenesis permease subunit